MCKLSRIQYSNFMASKMVNFNNGEDWERVVLTKMDWEREEREKIENFGKGEEGKREKRR